MDIAPGIMLIIMA